MSLRLIRASSQWLRTTGAVAHGIGAGNFTLAAWIKRGAAAANYDTVAAFGSSAYNLLLLARNSTANVFSAYMVGSATAAFDTTLAAGVWTHVAVRRDGTTLRGFVGGAIEATSRSSGDSVADVAAAIGSAQVTTPGFHFDGWIQSVALWDAALSDGQIAAMAAGTLPSALGGDYHWWPLDQTSGTVVNGDTGLRGLGGASVNPLIIGGGSPAWADDMPDVLRPPVASGGLSPLAKAALLMSQRRRSR